MSGSNANYIDYMYSQWERDPASVHSSWNAYFSGESFDTPPTLGKTNGGVGDVSSILAALQGMQGSGASSADAARASDESVRLQMLLRAFMTHGHLVADIDPL